MQMQQIVNQGKLLPDEVVVKVRMCPKRSFYEVVHTREVPGAVQDTSATAAAGLKQDTLTTAAAAGLTQDKLTTTAAAALTTLKSQQCGKEPPLSLILQNYPLAYHWKLSRQVSKHRLDLMQRCSSDR
jgi:hypothetical protein